MPQITRGPGWISTSTMRSGGCAAFGRGRGTTKIFVNGFLAGAAISGVSVDAVCGGAGWCSRSVRLPPALSAAAVKERRHQRRLLVDHWCVPSRFRRRRPSGTRRTLYWQDLRQMMLHVSDVVFHQRFERHRLIGSDHARSGALEWESKPSPAQLCALYAAQMTTISSHRRVR